MSFWAWSNRGLQEKFHSMHGWSWWIASLCSLLDNLTYSVFQVLARTITQFCVEPLEHVGKAFGKMLKGLTDELPWYLWGVGIPSLLALLIFTMLVFNGSRFNFFHLISIEPGQHDVERKMLKSRVEELQVEVTGQSKEKLWWLGTQDCGNTSVLTMQWKQYCTKTLTSVWTDVLGLILEMIRSLLLTWLDHFDGKCKTAVSPVYHKWGYCSVALNHQLISCNLQFLDLNWFHKQSCLNWIMTPMIQPAMLIGIESELSSYQLVLLSAILPYLQLLKLQGCQPLLNFSILLRKWGPE